MKKSLRFPSALTLSLTPVLLPLLAVHAAPPAVPANVRVAVLPAEVLLSWDASAGADHYRVYRAELDRRWVPIATQVAAPQYRDTDFLSLPCYYQIAACTASGECSATLEFTVNAVAPAISLVSAKARPLSDTSVSVGWYLQGTGGGNAMLEVGTSLNNLQLVGVNPAFASRHDFAIANLAQNTTYVYRLTSAGVNGAGVTYTEQFTTRPYTPPPRVVLNVSLPFPSLVTDEDTPVDFALTAMSPGPHTFFMANVPFGTVWGTSPNFTYLSGPERAAVDFFDVGYSDAFGTHYTTVFVTVNFAPAVPIALDGSVTVVEDIGGLFKVQATALDSSPLAVDCLIVDGPTNGTLTKLASEKMSVQYIPNPNFNGVDHFTFRAFDGARIGNVATVRLRVVPANDPPVAAAQTATVMRNTPQTIALAGSDPDGDVLSCVVLGGPSHGIVSGPTPNLTGQVTYTPAAGYTGPDSFTWQVTDPVGGSAAATVTIDVIRGNVAPTATAMAVSTLSGVSKSVLLTGSDPDGDALSFSVETAPAHGTLSGVAPNLVYTPTAGYLGADSFMFKASDGLADSAPAMVSIEVARGNQAPTATGGSVSTGYGEPVTLLLNGTDPDGDALVFSVVTLPGHGTLSGLGPNVVYTPATGYSGSDSFTFKVNDGQVDSAPATVTLNVQPMSQQPCAVSGLSAVGVSRDQIQLSWTDQCGQEAGFRIERSKDGRRWEPLATVGANVTSYTDADFNGRRTFHYRVCAYTGTATSDYSNVASASTR